MDKLSVITVSHYWSSAQAHFLARPILVRPSLACCHPGKVMPCLAWPFSVEPGSALPSRLKTGVAQLSLGCLQPALYTVSLQGCSPRRQ